MHVMDLTGKVQVFCIYLAVCTLLLIMITVEITILNNKAIQNVELHCNGMDSDQIL
jgi:hypothetical protein